MSTSSPASTQPGEQAGVRETEVKLSAGPDFELPSFSGVRGVAGLTARAETELEAVYFDTRELRLLQRGMTLRHRHESAADPLDGPAEHGWTLKLPGEAGGVHLERSEFTWPGEPDQMPSQAAALIRSVVRGDPLHPVARLVTRRRRWQVLDDQRRAVAEIDDDLVTIREGQHPGEQFRELEVELEPAAPPEVLETVANALERAGAERGRQAPKLSRALGRLGPVQPAIPELDKDSSIQQVVRAALGGALDTLVTQDPGIRLGGENEPVHKARVATRRLRSVLRILSPVLDQAWLRELRGELQWAGTALGEVRDADVMLAALNAEVDRLDPADAREVAPLLARLAGEREDARQRLLAVLDSERYLALLGTLSRGALEPPVTATEVQERAGKLLPGMVARTYRRLRRHVETLPAEPPDDDLHEIRKRAKELRYAAELAAPVSGKPATRLAVAAEALQEVLGEFHDAVVMAAWVRQAASDGPTPLALAAGEALGQFREIGADRRQRWPKAWKKLRKKRLRAWFSSAPIPEDHPGQPGGDAAPPPADGGWISPHQAPEPPQVTLGTT